MPTGRLTEIAYSEFLAGKYLERIALAGRYARPMPWCCS
jgi:hypothetical protein